MYSSGCLSWCPIHELRAAWKTQAMLFFFFFYWGLVHFCLAWNISVKVFIYNSPFWLNARLKTQPKHCSCLLDISCPAPEEPMREGSPMSPQRVQQGCCCPSHRISLSLLFWQGCVIDMVKFSHSFSSLQILNLYLNHEIPDFIDPLSWYPVGKYFTTLSGFTAVKYWI